MVWFQLLSTEDMKKHCKERFDNSEPDECPKISTAELEALRKVLL